MTQLAIGSSGSWKNPTGISVGSGGAWKKVSGIWVGVSGVWKQFYSAASAFTVTAGTNGFDIGYVSGSFGSISGGNLDGTHSIITIEDDPSPTTTIAINGFGSDPGSTWLTSLTVNGVTLLGTAATHSYGSGVAQWTWSSTLSLVNGTAYPSSLVHL